MRRIAVPMFLLAVALFTPRAVEAAQAGSQHVTDPAALRQAVVAKVETDRENRRAIVDLLERDDVSKTAAKMGLDVKRARQVVESLEGDQLANMARLAKDSNTPPKSSHKT